MSALNAGHAAASEGALHEPLTETLSETLSRWSSESTALERQGIYDWLATRVPTRRVLEIGCGFGASTAVLHRHGKSVFALDNRMDCLEAARARVPDAVFGLADVGQVHEMLVADLKAFAPEALVLWMAGAPADALPQSVPAAQAVMQYRLAFQRAAVALAAQVPTITTVHLADRTAFPWQMKDAGRETMAAVIRKAVIADAPFTLDVDDVQFRKLALPVSLSRHAMPAGIVPVLGEATLRRTLSAG